MARANEVSMESTRIYLVSLDLPQTNSDPIDQLKESKHVGRE